METTQVKQYKQEIRMTPELMERINELISHYPEGKQKSALIPVLHEVQDAHNDWLSVELQNKVAEILNIQPIEVYEVVTFYTMFNQKPVGKYMFEFCVTSCCAINQAEDMMEYTCEKLGVKPGEVTPDGLFSVVGVQCLGACGYAPMMQVGDFYHERLTRERIDAIIEECREGKVILHDK